MKVKLIIFGASLMGKAAFDIVTYIGEYEVVAFADNSKEKQNQLFLGLPVVSAEEAAKFNLPIFIASMFKYEIRDQLKELGCNKYFFSVRQWALEQSQEHIKTIENKVSYAGIYTADELLFDFEVNESHSMDSIEIGKVFIFCNTMHQLLTAILLKMIKLSNKRMVLLIGNKVESLTKAVGSLPSDFFDEILCFKYDCDNEKQFNEIAKKMGTPELFIFSELNLSIAVKLLKVMPVSTKVAFADEGTPFYELDYRQAKHRSFDKIRVDEFWGNNKSLFVYPKEILPFIEISPTLEDIKQHIGKLNELFKYTHKQIKNDIVYFDEPLHLYTSEENEKKFNNVLLDILKEKDVMIKLHPSSPPDKFKDSGFYIYENKNIPWEIYELNSILCDDRNNQTYVSIESNVMFFKFMFGSKINSSDRRLIFIHAVFSLTSNADFIDFKNKETLINRIGSKDILVPNTIEEFSALLNK